MEESKEWFKQAKKDLETARFNIDGKKLDAGIFFLQQSAEKALKALYIKKSRKLIRAHDLVLLAKKVNAPEKVVRYCKELSPAYLYTRYPDVSRVKNLDELSTKFLSYVKEILKWIKEKI